MSAAALRFEAVSKRFSAAPGRGGPVTALADFSLTIAPGETIGLLGANGSGKSTALKIALGLVRPTTGGCWVGGDLAGSRAARAQMGYLPEQGGVVTHLPAAAALAWAGWRSGLDRAAANRRAAELLERVGLSGAAQRTVATFSKGMALRLGLAQALMADAPLLLLDEPFAGVDPMAVRELEALLDQLKQAGKTILLTSHLVERTARFCDRLVMLDRGRVVAMGRPEDFGAAAAVVSPLEEVFVRQAMAGQEARHGPR